MSSELRRHQCCTMVDCLRPARELGGLCTTHYRALSPEARSFLEWEAAWTAVTPEPAVVPLRPDWDISGDVERWLATLQ